MYVEPDSVSSGNGIVTFVGANYFCLESEIYTGKPNFGRSPMD